MVFKLEEENSKLKNQMETAIKRQATFGEPKVRRTKAEKTQYEKRLDEVEEIIEKIMNRINEVEDIDSPGLTGIDLK